MLDMLVAMLLLFVKYFAIMTGAAIKQIPNPSPGKNAMHYLTCKTLHLIKFNNFIFKNIILVHCIFFYTIFYIKIENTLNFLMVLR